MEKLNSRYVGARPFETGHQLIFRGRQADTDQVFYLIQLENLVVLYGKSGTGKSSLLNAGVMPKVKDETDFEPIRVRFNAYKEGNDFVEPIETTRLFVRGNIPTYGTFLDRLIPNEATLWHDVKEHYIRNKGEIGLLLVIDQFEELFTYPIAHIVAFQEQLAEALYKTVPQRYWDTLQNQYDEGKPPLSSNELNLFQSKPALKVILSIRSDRLHLLNRLNEQLPTILKNLYELEALSLDMARKAIVEPAAMLQMDIFDTPPFLYDEVTLDHILDFLSHDCKTQSEAKGNMLVPTRQKIEATQLQIICIAIEKKVKALNLQMVSAQDVSNMETIIEQYYDNQIQDLHPNEQLPVRRLIEEGLVFEEEEHRLSLYEGQIFKIYKIKAETLQKLVDSHLLRAEPSLSGGYTYELSHDTLVAPVLRAKYIRLEADRKLVEAEAARLREAELAQAKAQADIERKRRQRATTLAIVSGVLFCVSTLAGIYAWQQRKKVQDANIRVVDSYFFDINNYILKLEYDNALQLCQKALNLNVESQKDSLQNLILEIAYFYTETDTAEAAIKTLNIVKQTGLSTNSPNVILNLQSEIRNLCTPHHFTYLEERYYPKMIDVEGGTFDMQDENKIKYKVRVNDFKIAQTETTFFQYNLFAKATRHRIDNPTWQFAGDNPAVNVSWYDAVFYLNWLNDRRNLKKVYDLTKERVENSVSVYDVKFDYTQKAYRLPTEAEWEYAASGGNKTQGFEYSGDFSIANVAWYSKNGANRTHKVATKKANELGLYDMSGNVWEWCTDSYSEKFNISPTKYWISTNVTDSRSLRGGSWYDDSDKCLIWSRDRDVPRNNDNEDGFRVLLEK